MTKLISHLICFIIGVVFSYYIFYKEERDFTTTEIIKPHTMELYCDNGVCDTTYLYSLIKTVHRR